MSVWGVSMVRDEEDVIEYTVRHTLTQIDQILIADNLSSDRTRPILDGLAEEFPGQIQVVDDLVLGYLQSEKMTGLAQQAMRQGASWVLPFDADEYWYATSGRRIADVVDGLAPDIQIMSANLYYHMPTGLDPVTDNPFERIGWRKREHEQLPKVMAKTSPDLVIHAGNHGATVPEPALRTSGLVIRHFSWRSREQYLHKIRTGEAAYAATSLPEGVGAHWRMWAGKSDEAVMEHFDRWFYSADPTADDSLIYDPVSLL